MPQKLGDVAGSTLALVALLAVLAAFDNRVRTRLGEAWSDVSRVGWLQLPTDVGHFVLDSRAGNMFLLSLLAAALLLVLLVRIDRV
jgi:DMSO/TMAO reductase YedYZ heme-binding membrane subunit